MSYSRGVHLVNPELEKGGTEFRTGRRHFSANKNQSSVFQYEERPQANQWSRGESGLNLTPQQDYGQGYARPRDMDQSPYTQDDAASLREAIRQRDEELRLLQEQPPYVPPQSNPRGGQTPTYEPAPLSKNSNLMEFERVKRDDVSANQQRRRTAEALAYQRNEKLRVKEMERAARESEALERLVSMRQLQEEEAQKKLDQRQKVLDYKRMLDIQAQSKAQSQADIPQARVIPRRSYTDNPENTQKPAYMASAIRDNPLADYTNQIEPEEDKSYAQNAAAVYGEEKMEYGQAVTEAQTAGLPPRYGRRLARNYHDTTQLIG